MPKTTRRKFTAAEKALLVGEIESRLRADGGSVRTIALSLGITDAHYHGWVKAGIRPPSSSQPDAARHRTDAERAAVVARIDASIAAGGNVRPACRVAGVSEKSYRRWKEKLAPPPVMRPVEVAELGEITALVPFAPAGLPALSAAPSAPAPALLAATGIWGAHIRRR